MAQEEIRTERSRGRAIATTVGWWLGLVLLLALLGVAILVTTGGRSIDGAESAYAEGRVNVRSCPSTDCRTLGDLAGGRQVLVLDHTRGERVDGSDEWLEIEHGDRSGFVLRSLTQTDDDVKAGGLWLLIDVLFGGAMLVVWRVGWSRRVGATIGGMRQEQSDGVVFGAAIVVGATAGALGFGLSVADGQTQLYYWSSAFVNFGAGMVAAAVTFVFAERLLRHRTDAAIDELRSDIAELRALVESQGQESAGSWPPSTTTRTGHHHWWRSVWPSRPRRERP